MFSGNKKESLAHVDSYGAVTIRSEVPMPLESGSVSAEFISFHGFTNRIEHFAMRFRNPAAQGAPLVRVHSECITGDLFGSLRCDCGQQLREAIDLLDCFGGYLLYLRQEGRGIGLYNKLDAYLLQDRGLDTFAANRALDLPDDARDFGCAAAMLRALGAIRISLMTNNPAKADQLKDHGIEVVHIVPTGTHLTAHNRDYLTAKAVLGGHALSLANVHGATHN